MLPILRDLNIQNIDDLNVSSDLGAIQQTQMVKDKDLILSPTISLFRLC
jgi:hypothetical protein